MRKNRGQIHCNKTTGIFKMIFFKVDSYSALMKITAMTGQKRIMLILNEKLFCIHVSSIFHSQVNMLLPQTLPFRKIVQSQFPYLVYFAPSPIRSRSLLALETLTPSHLLYSFLFASPLSLTPWVFPLIIPILLPASHYLFNSASHYLFNYSSTRCPNLLKKPLDPFLKRGQPQRVQCNPSMESRKQKLSRPFPSSPARNSPACSFIRAADDLSFSFPPFSFS